MSRVARSSLLALLPLAVVACGDSQRAPGPDTLAVAAGFELGVEETAEMIAPVADLPPDPGVVEALTDFWVDYSLLGLTVNREGGVEGLDLSPLTRQQLNQELILLLREEVIDDDVEITEEELREVFEADRPGERVRARHILLGFGDDRAPARVDSLRGLAEELRDRARAGGDFAALAEEYSDDPGSAARGGDLSFFERGVMVPPFEEAAFALEPGEVSDVVETQFGFHIIRVEERETPSFDDVREPLRQELVMRRTTEAESIYVAGIEEPANLRVADGAADRVRELADSPESPLQGRARSEALVQFQGGSYTAGDFRLFLLNQPPQLRMQLSGATDEQLDDMLLSLARGELLVQEAERLGLELDAEEVMELEEEIRSQLRQVADLLGLSGITPGEGETLEQAVSREVRELLPRLVRGEQDVYPLGPLAVVLREAYTVQIVRENMDRVAERITEIRSERGIQEPTAPGLEDLDQDELEALLRDALPDGGTEL